MWGKLIGGWFGWMLLGPLGALLGLWLGHQFDRGLSLQRGAGVWGSGAGRSDVQQTFFDVTFSVMGHVAKADGHVSEHEIRLATAIMDELQLDAELRHKAIGLFNQGKQTDFDVDAAVARLHAVCRQGIVLQMFIGIQLRAAYADGALSDKERSVLGRVCRGLGFSERDLAQMERMFRAEHDFGGTRGGWGAGGRSGSRSWGSSRNADQISEAYELLGVKPTNTDAEVKSAYRRLMSQNHPDKLIAKGLPEEMIKLATEKTQAIKAAYEAVRIKRGMKT